MPALAILFGCSTDIERPAHGRIPDYYIKYTSDKIIVDGKLDEASWKRAKIISLKFPWEEQTGEKQFTNVRMIWDKDYLYIAYKCVDNNITSQYEKHDDPTYEDDAVEIFINAGPKLNTYVGLEINARAVLYDYLNTFPVRLEKSFDLDGVQIAVQINGTLNDITDQDKDWTLELAIPLNNFTKFSNGKPIISGTTWRANINRWDGTEPHRRLSMWSDSGRILPNPHYPARFGRIHFAE